MERLPRIGEEVPVREIQRVSGGTAANVSVAAARLLGPSRVAFIGALGKDQISEEQIRILDNEGVDSSGILILPDEESGQAYISINDDGANEIHTYFGANLKISSKHLKEPVRYDLIKQSKVCVIMDPPLETASELARICKKNDITVIWDPGVYAEKGMGALQSIIKYTDYFVLNQLEYENLLGNSEPKKIVKALSKYAEGLKVIIKKGAHGCILIDEEDNFIEMEAVPLGKIKMKVVNTVGCGDAFIGGFASAKVKGYSDMESLRMASAAGSFKATRKETRGGPTAKELQNLISLWKNIE
jgi:ribokinase